MGNKVLNLFEDENQQGYIIGIVTHVVFQTNTSFFKVLSVEIQESDLTSLTSITITGNFADLKDDISYKFYGQIKEHPKYGEQFQAINYEVLKPETIEGLVTYLSGADFVGIGKATAQKIVAQLGNDCLEILTNHPEKIAQLNISQKQKESLKQGIEKTTGIETILFKLGELGFSKTMINKILNQYQEKTLEILNTDPYRLVLEIEGIGFNRADKIAAQLGLQYDCKQRIQAAFFYVLYDHCLASGDTYLQADLLVDRVLELLMHGQNQLISIQKVTEQLVELAFDKKIIVIKDKVYPKKFYQAEVDITQNLARLNTQVDEQKQYSREDIMQTLAKVEKMFDVTYDEIQKKAIMKALQSPVFLLTGGPGTGKTTIINGIVAVYALLNDIDLGKSHQAHFPILLAAPTGRAAKRMSETTGLNAVTIHRLLGLSGYDIDSEPNDLEGSLLIIDETSMVDVELMSLLLQSTPSDMQVIFVGDKNQLPSVGPGQVFADLLASQCLAKEELVKIYRQSDSSSIATLAAQIKQGQWPTDLTAKKGDRSFIACQATQVADILKQVVQVALKKGNQAKDIQVLAPMYRGQAGIDALNKMLQELFNPLTKRKKELAFNENQTLRIGDRVLQLVNDPENNVFNGDIGKVIGLELAQDKNESDKIIVSFDQNEVTYERKDWHNLALAYCMSIHKSQGGEFPIVILPMVSQYKRMLARNLLYTAITRAKDKLILLGQQEAFLECINEDSSQRQTTLQQMLVQQFDESSIKDEKKANLLKEIYLTKDLIMSEAIDPLIGMKGLSPFDFMDEKSAAN